MLLSIINWFGNFYFEFGILWTILQRKGVWDKKNRKRNAGVVFLNTGTMKTMELMIIWKKKYFRIKSNGGIPASKTKYSTKFGPHGKNQSRE